MKLVLLPFAVCFCAAISSARAPADEPQPADLVLHGGTVLTCDAEGRSAEALAARDGRIVAIGSSAEMRTLIGPQTRVIELGGRTAMPGFIEGHGHLLSLGETKLGLDLTLVRSWKETVERVAATASRARPGSWIIGRGWHQEKWTDLRAAGSRPAYPTHDALSAVTPHNPVLLIHATGHMSLANAAAMQAAGIGPQTADPRGGEILRDAEGLPTGVLRETAQELVQAANRRSTAARTADEVESDALRAIERGARECLECGVTSFQDAGCSIGDMERYRRLAEAGRLPIRLYIMLRGSPDELEKNLARCRLVGHADDHLTVRAIKCMADGALGSHGARLLEPYDDLPDRSGLVVQPIEQIRRTALLALRHDYQLCTHAIGDRANREVLDLYREVLGGRRDSKALRWRIEHAQHLHPDDIPRFAELGVIASMQTCHATSDGPFVIARLGEWRARTGAYAWRSLLDAGARIVNGTDAPVEPLSPILNFHAAVMRRLPDAKPFFPEQRMMRIEALRSMTADAAWGAFEEQLKGSLEPGKLADVIVLTKSPLTAAEDELPRIRVDCTIVGGEVLYERILKKGT